jgi:hypothetical protein
MLVLYSVGGTPQWAVRHLDLLSLPIDLQIVIAQPVVAKNDTLLAAVSDC